MEFRSGRLTRRNYAPETAYAGTLPSAEPSSPWPAIITPSPPRPPLSAFASVPRALHTNTPCAARASASNRSSLPSNTSFTPTLAQTRRRPPSVPLPCQAFSLLRHKSTLPFALSFVSCLPRLPMSGHALLSSFFSPLTRPSARRRRVRHPCHPAIPVAWC